MASRLVLDEQLGGKRLVDGLSSRGIDVTTVGELGLTGRVDPDVARSIEQQSDGPWVLVTMDLTIVEDHPGFDWSDYAIAWVIVHDALRGAPFETKKRDIVHQHCLKMSEQARGDHFSYFDRRFSKSPPGVSRQLRGPSSR